MLFFKTREVKCSIEQVVRYPSYLVIYCSCPQAKHVYPLARKEST